jgi:hypothetical protein
MLRKSIEILCTGKTEDDILLALDEAVRLIKEGYLAGSGENDSGSHSFDVVDEDGVEPLKEFAVYQEDTDGSERKTLVIDAKDKESARAMAERQGITNITDVSEI